MNPQDTQTQNLQNTENTQMVDQSLNPNSPYYIHPSDNPSMKLVSMKFNGQSYNDWKRSMVISLSAKNKMGFVDGSIKKPELNDMNYKAWDRCNSMMISWLLGVLEQDIARSVFILFNSKRNMDKSRGKIWSRVRDNTICFATSNV